jgi:hypothetical protein
VQQPRLTFAVSLKENGSSGSLRLGSNRIASSRFES